MTAPAYSLSSPAYRPDIDGLRAVAVLSVVGFHAFPGLVKGGFIGVDVFFVISGFLISRIILLGLRDQNFSFLDFYGRRIRRIFPALLAVLAATYIFGWFSLYPDEYGNLGKHIASGAGFVSNLVLLGEAGYFDSSAETKPLLHLWSLGIEEQFYCLWPLALWLAWRGRFHPLALTGLVAFGSLALNVKSVGGDAAYAFYSPQTRFWELLSGCALAWVSIHGKNFSHSAYLNFKFYEKIMKFNDGEKFKSVILRNCSSISGFSFLIYGFFNIDKTVNFPGAWALIPVSGAVFIISAGPHSWINRVILSNRAAVWFGLVSFPLYLWHWPLLSFATILEGGTPPRPVRLAAVCISLALAWLTYKFIELPIRRQGSTGKNCRSLSLGMVFVGLAGGAVYASNGVEQKSSGDYGHDAFFEFHENKYLRCENKNIYETSNVYKKWVRCWQTKPGEPDLVLLGDSHAEHLFAGLAEALPDKSIAFYIEGGRPALDDPEFNVIFEELKSAKKKMHILIADHYVADYAVNPGRIVEDIERTINFLSAAGHKVALLGDVLKFNASPQECLFRGRSPPLRKKINVNDCEIKIEDAQLQEDIYQPYLKFISEKKGTKYFPISRILCGVGSCPMFDGVNLYYRDQNHLSLIGSMVLGRRLAAEIQRSSFLN